MDIVLSSKTEATVRQKVVNGKYDSASEVVEAAVLLLDDRDRFEQLRSLLHEAEQEIREGKVLEWTPELQRKLRREAEEMVRMGGNPA